MNPITVLLAGPGGIFDFTGRRDGNIYNTPPLAIVCQTAFEKLWFVAKLELEIGTADGYVSRTCGPLEVTGKARRFL
jgi:hypothetical protein